ncbi:hypothetical protein CEP53_006845 [Fusarium sp. AF-6]|nr:hypothetical protein CEP53_006845 [Fusarium sp. AF-6]
MCCLVPRSDRAPPLLHPPSAAGTRPQPEALSPPAWDRALVWRGGAASLLSSHRCFELCFSKLWPWVLPPPAPRVITKTRTTHPDAFRLAPRGFFFSVTSTRPACSPSRRRGHRPTKK